MDTSIGGRVGEGFNKMEDSCQVAKSLIFIFVTYFS